MKQLFFLLLPLLATACSDAPATKTTSAADGANVYRQYCTVCHGADGQLGLNGAFNLATSTLSEAMTVEVITYGRNAMAPYEELLSKEEIAAVTDYILTLRR